MYIIMDLKQLHELASFSLAKYVWSCYVDDAIKTICSQLFRDNPVFDWKKITEFEKCFMKLYPRLPNTIRKTVLCSASLIDKELTRWKPNLCDVVCRFSDIHWTPYFTIDRVKSQCRSKKFDITDSQLCECCLVQYVETSRSNFSCQDNKRIQNMFGDYADHAILYWYWYGRLNRSFLSHIFKYHRYYQEGRPVENIFRLSVFCEYETAVIHYWSKMSKPQQLSYHSRIIPLMLLESDNLEFIEFNELLPFHTFSFFWYQLTEHERFEIVHYYFVDFYRYMLYHEQGLEWVYAFLNNWNPFLAPIEYFKLLRLAIDTNNLDLFVLLWKRKLAVLSFEAIGHLMWTLLFQKDTDFKISIMIINDYENERKIDVLNELDKRIECIKLDFREKIDKFLDAASLTHLRVAGFPRNPKIYHGRVRSTRCRRSPRMY